MARSDIELTGAWQQIAAGACTIRIKDLGGQASAPVAFNETAADTAALEDLATAGAQYVQNEAKPTFAKGEGVTVTVDEAG